MRARPWCSGGTGSAPFRFGAAGRPGHRRPHPPLGSADGDSGWITGRNLARPALCPGTRSGWSTGGVSGAVLRRRRPPAARPGTRTSSPGNTRPRTSTTPAPDPGGNRPPLRTANGVSVGATVSELQTAYGDRLELFDEAAGRPVLRGPDCRRGHLRHPDQPRARRDRAHDRRGRGLRGIRRSMEPIAALERIAYLLEKARVAHLPGPGLPEAAADARRTAGRASRNGGRAAGTLQDLPGIGEKTERVIVEALAGEVPAYLQQLEEEPSDVEGGGQPASTAPPPELCGPRCGATATPTPTGPTAAPHRRDGPSGPRPRPRLHGPHRPLAPADGGQGPVAGAAAPAARGGGRRSTRSWRRSGSSPASRSTSSRTASLDQDEELLAQLDVVVASVHSKLRMERDEMTRRMIAGRRPTRTSTSSATAPAGIGGRARGRPESEFDAELVFAACRRVRQGGRDQLPPGAARPAPAPAAPGRRDGLQVGHRHRRPRPRPAGVAALRLRAGRRVRRDARSGGQHLGRRRAAGLDRRTPAADQRLCPSH